MLQTSVALLMILALALVVLAILMPLFVLQIKQATQQTVEELRTLNDNIRRLNATSSGRPQHTATRVTGPDALEEKARAFGVSTD